MARGPLLSRAGLLDVTGPHPTRDIILDLNKKDALNGASFLLYMADGLRSDIRYYRIILVVFVLTAVALAYFLFRSDKLNTLDPLNHLVAQLVLGTQP